MPKPYSYDSACYDLAESFLNDSSVKKPTETDKQNLAQWIQDSIETWLSTEDFQ